MDDKIYLLIQYNKCFEDGISELAYKTSFEDVWELANKWYDKYPKYYIDCIMLEPNLIWNEGDHHVFTSHDLSLDRENKALDNSENS